MNYISTRGLEKPVSSAQAIRQGIAADGGLFVPEPIPTFTPEEITGLASRSYADRAWFILSRFLPDFRADELREAVEAAYGDEERFVPSPAPLVQLNKYNDREFMLELWHGPTAAFKDIALQLLPHLMTAAQRKAGIDAKLCLLTATSGDTGKAALEGFRDVPGTAVVVFYPSRGVSETQRLQMVTQEGTNCHVIAVDGNFDDTQNGVKAIFADSELAAEMAARGVLLSSANSINWGRLVPQIVYYFSAYADLLATQKIESFGEPINLVVPTGNFGNILAAWYARAAGLPVHRLICASNRNKVLSDFIRTGEYSIKREFYRTTSPSMDILISSNLERLLFELTGRSSERVRQWMTDLRTDGKYQIDRVTLRALQEVFVGGFCDDQGAARTILEVYDRTDHLVDPHTAVGFNVYGRYLSRSEDQTRTVFVSTASPLKFGAAVGDALYGNGFSRGRSPAKMIEELSVESGLEIPPSIADVANRPVLHSRVISKDQMCQAMLESLGLRKPSGANMGGGSGD